MRLAPPTPAVPVRALARACLVAAAVALAALSGGLLAGPGAGAAWSAPAADDVVQLQPGRLPRGADVQGPHVEGTTVVDGTRRLAVPGAERLELLGRVGPAYAVRAFDARARQRVLRVDPAGAVSALVAIAPRADLARLSDDGTRLAQSRVRPGARASTTVTVWDTTSGDEVDRLALDGLVSVLDLDAQRVVLGSFSGSTRTWAPGTDRVRTLVRRAGTVADLATDRLASLTADPYDGGCTVVSTLSRPGRALWRSCRERVHDFSPDGRRMSTVDLLADGQGPSLVSVRGVGGALRDSYGVRGWFGLVRWETPTALLLETHTRRQVATVRCRAARCERASEVAPAPAA